MAQPTSFLSFTADSVTPAHLNLIDLAASFGNLTVAVMSDRALWGNRALPVLTLEERMNLTRHLRGVANVVVQNEWSYSHVLDTVKPHFFVHGSDWDSVNTAESVKMQLSSWGGHLEEVPFQSDLAWLEPSHRASKFLDSGGGGKPSPDSRRASLSRVLKFDRPVLAMEAHNPLSAMVAESVSFEQSLGDVVEKKFFDALWSSSLTDSTSRAFPDIEALSFDSRLANIREIFRVSSRPLIMDLDTGGEPEILSLRLSELESAGVSAGVIEDKVGLKKNSLLGNDVFQEQATALQFSKKIEYVKRYQKSREFMLVARVESLILDAGMDDALQRSHSYVSAGADAVMIHSRKRDPSEIYEFLDKFRHLDSSTPIVLVPTSYNSETATDLYKRGANLIIYANHMLRAAVPAMQKVAQQILLTDRGQEADESLLSIDGILGLIPGTN